MCACDSLCMRKRMCACVHITQKVSSRHCKACTVRLDIQSCLMRCPSSRTAKGVQGRTALHYALWSLQPTLRGTTTNPFDMAVSLLEA